MNFCDARGKEMTTGLAREVFGPETVTGATVLKPIDPKTPRT